MYVLQSDHHNKCKHPSPHVATNFFLAGHQLLSSELRAPLPLKGGDESLASAKWVLLSAVSVVTCGRHGGGEWLFSFCIRATHSQSIVSHAY